MKRVTVMIVSGSPDLLGELLAEAHVQERILIHGARAQVSAHLEEHRQLARSRRLPPPPTTTPEPPPRCMHCADCERTQTVVLCALGELKVQTWCCECGRPFTTG